MERRLVRRSRAREPRLDRHHVRSIADRPRREPGSSRWLGIRGKEKRSGEIFRRDRVGTDHDAGDAPAVLGVTSARRVISMRPAGSPPMVMSKKHTGLAMVY